MSSILKALRKLEDEKAAIGDQSVDIARDILKGSVRKPGRQLFWPLLSFVLFVLLIGSAFYYSRRDKAITSVSVLPPPVPPAAQPAVPVPANTEAREFSEPAHHRPVLPLPQVVKTETAEKPVEKRLPPVKPQPEPAALTQAGSPFLKLTGIAYRQNPAERIAIINDLPVMLGTGIEGAQVVDIQMDKAILSWKGERIELLIEPE